jgi:hypothetical protein
MSRLLDNGRRVDSAQSSVAVLTPKHPTTGGITRTLSNYLAGVVTRQRNAIELTQENVQWALANAPRGAAPGPSGWTIEHWKDLAEDKDALECLIAFMNKGMCGRLLPSSMRQLWGACNTVALAKPPDEPGAAPSHRPISMGETLRRITGKDAMRQLKEHITPYLEPLQYGAGSNRGCAHIHTLLREQLRRCPDFVLLKCDVSNAFNSMISRHIHAGGGEQIPYAAAARHAVLP